MEPSDRRIDHRAGARTGFAAPDHRHNRPNDADNVYNVYNVYNVDDNDVDDNVDDNVDYDDAGLAGSIAAIDTFPEYAGVLAGSVQRP